MPKPEKVNIQSTCEIQNKSTVNYNLTWNELKKPAKKMFNIFGNDHELDFAKKAWSMVIDAGLAKYKNDVERVSAALKFISLGDLYRDFCDVTFDKFKEPDYEEWAEALRISNFRLGQLIGKHKSFLKDDYQFAETITAVHYLANSFRKEIWLVLKEAFRSESVLFFEMYKTSYPEHQDYLLVAQDYEGESYDDVLNKIIPQKEKAYNWICKGCYPLYE